MKGIVAVNNLGFIGKDNRLMWKSGEDLNHFKRMTDGCTLLVGWNTHQTLPELEGREVIVDGRFTVQDLSKIQWCIGGKKTYEKYQRLFTELHISHIDHNGIGDTLFPNLKYLNPKCKIFNYHFSTDTK